MATQAWAQWGAVMLEGTGRLKGNQGIDLIWIWHVGPGTVFGLIPGSGVTPRVDRGGMTAKSGPEEFSGFRLAQNHWLTLEDVGSRDHPGCCNRT